jgi:hypothetical protein
MKSFLDHLCRQKQVTCLLTTHFLDGCERLKENPCARTAESRRVNGSLHYEDEFRKGVSKIKGGLQDLKDLGFPR